MSQSSHKLSVLPHLIKWIPKNPTAVKKVISFDLDHTIIKPVQGRFSRTSDDWLFMKYGEIDTLEKLSNYLNASPDLHFVLFSNQGGIVSEPKTAKSCMKHVDKINKILKHISDIDSNLCDRIWIYCATKKPASLFGKTKSTKSSNKVNKITKNNTDTATKRKIIDGRIITPELFDIMRKPNRGMFDEFIKDAGDGADSISVSFYCGDAAGRPNDFSDSDKAFADTIGVPFKLPEEFFR